jgi:hypothetical protein
VQQRAAGRVHAVRRRRVALVPGRGGRRDPARNIACADGGTIALSDAGAAGENGGLSGNTPDATVGVSDASMPAGGDASAPAGGDSGTNLSSGDAGAPGATTGWSSCSCRVIPTSGGGLAAGGLASRLALALSRRRSDRRR